MEGAPKFVESQALPDVSYAGFARGLGLHGDHRRQARRDRPGLGPGAGRGPAHGAGRALRPQRPPIPPHATFEQVKAAARPCCAATRTRWGDLREGVKTKVQEFLPHPSRGRKRR